MNPPSPNAPDFAAGYLRIPHGLFLALYCRSLLTRRQLQIVSLVLRESWGWQSRSAGVRLWTPPLSTTRIAQATGLSTDRLARDLRELLERGVLQEQNGRYQLVPYPQRWMLRAPKRRQRPPKPRGGDAETTLSPDCDRKDRKRYKRHQEKPELSTQCGGPSSTAKPEIQYRVGYPQPDHSRARRRKHDAKPVGSDNGTPMNDPRGERWK